MSPQATRRVKGAPGVKPSGNGRSHLQASSAGGVAPVDSAESMLSIGRLAEVAGVSSRTIRYYEELGILPQPGRSRGGTRKYPRAYRFYIEGALALKELGFSLEEIRLLGRLALGDAAGRAEGDRAAGLIRDKMKTLEHKIRVLNRLREVLQAQSGGDVMERLAGLIEMSREGASGTAV